MVEMANLFERLSGGRPPAQFEIKAQKRQDEEALLSSAQKLLDFLQRWTKNTINLRDIRTLGPHSIRDRKDAVRAAEILCHFGWLAPIRSAHYDGRAWQITRKPVVGPAVAADWQLYQGYNRDFVAKLP
jgi:hypothetical protein